MPKRIQSSIPNFSTKQVQARPDSVAKQAAAAQQATSQQTSQSQQVWGTTTKQQGWGPSTQTHTRTVSVSTFQASRPVARVPTSAELAAPALALISLGKKEGRAGLEAFIAKAQSDKTLPKAFEGIIDAGKYEAMLEVLGKKDSPALRALAEARPTYDEARLNAATEATIRAHPEWKTQYPYDTLIIPGYTPVDTDKPMSLDDLPAARMRLDLAIQDFKDGKAPVILVSGGSVHPSGTPHNEGLMMRQYLIDHGIPADRVLVDAHARHSTTNLRNAGRMMSKLGLERGLIATGFESNSKYDQHFYFAKPVMSTFHLRSIATLGYEVGKLKDVDRNHIAFKPSSKNERVKYADPLDP